MLLTLLLRGHTAPQQPAKISSFTHCRDPFWFEVLLLLYIKVIFLHICRDLRGRESEPALRSVPKTFPLWEADLISPPWSDDRFPDALGSQSLISTPKSHIRLQMVKVKWKHHSFHPLTSHFAANLIFEQACHELHRISWIPVLCRHCGNMQALRGLTCQPLQPLLLLFSQREACTVFPACSKGVFHHFRWAGRRSFRMQSCELYKS